MEPTTAKDSIGINRRAPNTPIAPTAKVITAAGMTQLPISPSTAATSGPNTNV